MHIYMGVDVRKNCNRNVTVYIKFFQISFLTKYKFFYTKRKNKKIFVAVVKVSRISN